jgi:hypothetical protein
VPRLTGERLGATARSLLLAAEPYASPSSARDLATVKGVCGPTGRSAAREGGGFPGISVTRAPPSYGGCIDQGLYGPVKRLSRPGSPAEHAAGNQKSDYAGVTGPREGASRGYPWLFVTSI